MDRNYIIKITESPARRSLSARRAWIEILYQLYDTYAKVVALRKESVDRNNRIAKPFREQFKSLSARRAWIEIAERA